MENTVMKCFNTCAKRARVSNAEIEFLTFAFSHDMRRKAQQQKNPFAYIFKQYPKKDKIKQATARNWWNNNTNGFLIFENQVVITAGLNMEGFNEKLASIGYEVKENEIIPSDFARDIEQMENEQQEDNQSNGYGTVCYNIEDALNPEQWKNLTIQEQLAIHVIKRSKRNLPVVSKNEAIEEMFEAAERWETESQRYDLSLGFAGQHYQYLIMEEAQGHFIECFLRVAELEGRHYKTRKEISAAVDEFIKENELKFTDE